MREICGKQIATKLSDMVDPRSCAILVIDVQNDYCYDEEGGEKYPRMIEALRQLIQSARESHVFVIYVQDTLLPSRKSDSPGWMRHYLINKDDAYIPKETATNGSAGQEFVKKISPTRHDLIIQKFRSSAFYGTSVDLILRSNGIRSVIITGAVTYGCVESTCRDASNEYFVVVPQDCVAGSDQELHEACLKIMRARYDVCSSKDIISEWNRKLVETV